MRNADIDRPYAELVEIGGLDRVQSGDDLGEVIARIAGLVHALEGAQRPGRGVLEKVRPRVETHEREFRRDRPGLTP